MVTETDSQMLLWFSCMETQVQLHVRNCRLVVMGRNSVVIGWTRSDVSDSQQVTLKAGSSCSHEQHSQNVCLTEDNNFIMNFLPRLPLSFKLMHHGVKTDRKWLFHSSIIALHSDSWWKWYLQHEVKYCSWTVIMLNYGSRELFILENGTSFLLTPVYMYILFLRTVKYMNVQFLNVNTTQASVCNVTEQFVQ